MGELLTDRFRPGSEAAIRITILGFLSRRWWVAALPLAAMSVAGLCGDIRWLYVTAITLFLIYPTVLFAAWAVIVTRRWAVNALFSQQVHVLSDNTVRIHYCHAVPASGENQPKLPADVVVPAADIDDCRLMGRYIVVRYRGSEYLILPLSAFYNESDATTFLLRFASNDELARIEQ